MALSKWFNKNDYNIDYNVSKAITEAMADTDYVYTFDRDSIIVIDDRKLDENQIFTINQFIKYGTERVFDYINSLISVGNYDKETDDRSYIYELINALQSLINFKEEDLYVVLDKKHMCVDIVKIQNNKPIIF